MAIWKRPFYKRWKNMIDNTTNPNCSQYNIQGALGIRVDKSFLNYLSFENYVLKHLGPPQHPRICLVRKDKLKNWEPGNLMWATTKENGWIRRDRLLVTYKHKKKSLAAWCEELDLPYMRTFNRIHDYGWSVKDAFEIRENCQ